MKINKIIILLILISSLFLVSCEKPEDKPNVIETEVDPINEKVDVDTEVEVKPEKKNDIKVLSGKWGTPISAVNTEAWEDAVFIYGDGNTLYYTMGEHLKVDSYVSSKVNGKWSSPVSHEFNLPDFPDGAVHTQDNKKLYFASVRPGTLGSADIYIFENGKVENIGAPINTEYLESEPYISPDDNTFYFASNKPGGIGGGDIYLSSKVDGKWTEPVNIGEPVNSKKDETQPFLTADGNKIYFTATDRDGIGGPAIFMSEKTGSTWSEPEAIIKGFVGEPTLTNDEQNLYFVHIFREGSKLTDADIYYVKAK